MPLVDSVNTDARYLSCCPHDGRCESESGSLNFQFLSGTNSFEFKLSHY